MQTVTLKDIIKKKIEIETYDYEKAIKENNKGWEYFHIGNLMAYNDIYNDIDKLTEEQFIRKYDSMQMVWFTDYFYITKRTKYEMTILDGYDLAARRIVEMICPLLWSDYRYKAYKEYNLIIPETCDFYNHALMKKINLDNKCGGYFVANDDDEDDFIEFTNDVKEKYDKAFDYFMKNVYNRLIKQIKDKDRNIFEDDKFLIN